MGTGLLYALKEMGLSKHVSMSRPEEAMDAVRFMFRDADAKPDQRPKRASQKAAASFLADDDQDDDAVPLPVGGQLPSFPSTRESASRKSRHSAKHAEDLERSQLLSAPIVEGRSEVTGKRYPVEATPGTVIFLLRVVSCLRGIAVSLGCQHSYLKAFTPYARKALRASLSTPEVPQAFVPETSLEAALFSVAQRLCDNGDALGLQVCVFRHGKKHAEVACGEMGPLDPRPMHSAVV